MTRWRAFGRHGQAALSGAIPVIAVIIVIALALLAACSAPQSNLATRADETSTPFPTPAADVLSVTGTSASGERLRVIVPAITVEQRAPRAPVKVFVALVDPQGTYSYLLYPANRPGDDASAISLVEHPLELGIGEATPGVTLWVLAYHASGHSAAQSQGWDALATSLAQSFRAWLASGNPADDPLAGTIRASDGALHAWFAEIEVLGQALVRLAPENEWSANLGAVGLNAGALSLVYDVDHLLAGETPSASEAVMPTPTSVAQAIDRLVLDETFDDPASAAGWYQGRSSTFVNEISGGGYQIRLLGASQRPTALSWGSLGGLRVDQARVEAEMRLTESGAGDTAYGLWLRYQDMYNFLTVGLSDRGEYRVAVVSGNRVQRVIQDWQHHPAIGTGTAANVVSVEMHADGHYDLRVNDVFLLSFLDRTFGEGSVGFFCSAQAPPATCRLETLRIWQPSS